MSARPRKLVSGKPLHRTGIKLLTASMHFSVVFPMVRLLKSPKQEGCKLRPFWGGKLDGEFAEFCEP